MGAAADWTHQADNRVFTADVVATPDTFRQVVDRAEAFELLGRTTVRDRDLADFDQFADTCDGFDVRDVNNFALYRLPARSRAGLEARALVRAATVRGVTAPLRRNVTLEASCGSSRCTGGRWELPSFQGITFGPPSFTATGVAQAGTAIPQPQTFSALPGVSETKLRYHQVPEALSELRVARRRGVGDCWSLAAQLEAELVTRGADARVVNGVLLGPLSAREHAWVRTEGRSGSQVLDPTAHAMAAIVGTASVPGLCAAGAPVANYFESTAEGRIVLSHACDSWVGSPNWALKVTRP